MQEKRLTLPREELIRSVSMEELVPLFLERLEAGQTIRFAPRGVSMLPMLRPGTDTVVLSSAPERLKKYDLPLYRRDDGHYVLHRVVRAGETYTCMGDNQFRPESGIRRDQVIALVTAFRRGKRNYSVIHPGYQLYCRFWHYSCGTRHFLRRTMGWLRRHLK